MKKAESAASAGFAEIQVINNGTNLELKVVVPRGTSFTDTLKLKPDIAKLIGKLTGCPACNSGIPIHFHESDIVQQVVRVDLARMR